MDANEFLKKVTPAGQRSRLAPFWNDITKLRQSGCTLEQVCEFLAANGLDAATVAADMDGRFASAFIRARKPAR